MIPRALPRIAPLPGLSLLFALALATTGCNLAATPSVAAPLPDPTLDTPNAASQHEQVAVLAGGCFWGLQAVFEHVKGVHKVWAGYAGGSADTAQYERVGDGDTGHAESVKVVFDPAKVSYGQLLKVYFSVAHDPTELNRQGPDSGTQYRSEIFYTSEQQHDVARAYVAQLSAAKAFADPIVTKIAPLPAFYPAEAYHQDYARLHPDNMYIVYNDAPKVEQLKRQFPSLYQSEPVRIDAK